MVVAIGELLWDVFPDGTKKIGGSSTNVALHLIKQDVKCLIISAVGDDDDGIELINNLTVKNLSTRLVQTKKDLPTSRVQLQLDNLGNATYTIAENVAWDAIDLNPQTIESVEAAEAFIYCSLTCRSDHSEKTILTLAEKARLAVFDLNLRAPYYDTDTIKKLLESADVLKINQTELSYVQSILNLQNEDLEESLKQISKQFKLKVICHTLGSEGALVYYENNFYQQQGFNINVADTVGAGDAFLASFVSGFLSGEKMPTILEHACLVGAFVTSKSGANPFYNEEILNEFRKSIR